MDDAACVEHSEAYAMVEHLEMNLVALGHSCETDAVVGHVDEVVVHVD